MTSTYEGYYAFTDPTRLGAKQPDHLTTCNAVESEKKKKLFAQRSINLPENDQKLYKKEIAVPKNIAPSCCAGEPGPSLAIAVGLGKYDDPKSTDGKMGRNSSYRVLLVFK